MVCRGANPPFVVWTSCFLWLTSLFAIICHKSKVACCPLWMCIVWLILINIVGVTLCIHKIVTCKPTTNLCLRDSMTHYRTVPKYKHFMDNLQWALRCCGLNSYRDWFSRDWYDKIRDYEWDPYTNRHNANYKKGVLETDSVPLSCCKSGSCISNYLSELGTYSINTTGCSKMVYQIILVSMIGHFLGFCVIIVIEFILLRYIMAKTNCKACDFENNTNVYNVTQILKAKDNFDASSGSLQMNPEDSDDVESAERCQGD